MINVSFFVFGSGEICGFKIEGHAGFDEHGKDIVCSAVSSAAYMTANTITGVMKIDADLKVFDDVGFMYMRVPNKSVSSCRIIFSGFRMHLGMLEEIYPENIRVSYEEVKQDADD